MLARDDVLLTQQKPAASALWLVLTLSVAILYAALALPDAFANSAMVQDDARNYLLGAQQFLDPEQFANDLMANYLHSITPWGLSTLYWLGSQVGIAPLVVSKLLPSLLSVLLGWYGYQLTLALFPVPHAAFLSSLILLQSVWSGQDIAAASPRSFWMPLLAAFLYYFVKRSWLAVALVVCTMGLFCPLASVLIGLWLGWRVLFAFKFGRVRRPEWLILALTIAMLLPYAFSQSEFGPTVTAAQARTMLEFLPGGRLPFFYPDPVRFWFEGNGSAFSLSFNPPVIGLGLLLPLLVYKRDRIPLLMQLNPAWTVLPQLAGTGCIGFFLAHLLFVRLHFPSRYTTNSWRIAMAIAAGIVIAIAIQQSKSWLAPKFRSVIAIALGSLILFYPQVAWKKFPDVSYSSGLHPAVYEFLKTTPKSSLSAYLGVDANSLPLSSNRPTLTAQEFALPFHLGYYRQIRQRTVDLIEAQYSPSQATVKRFLQTYPITYWLIDPTTFTPDYVRNFKWLRVFEPERSQAIASLESGQTPAIQQWLPTCTIKTLDGIAIVNPECVLSQKD